ncbi:MAG: valine--tRNA ligase [Candidatus Doudnabacteria bacterium]|jgi:valyl-tRNA synthetase
MELPKAYDHTQAEGKIYQTWLDSGYFNPDKLPSAESREPFTISLPPPNVTGILHMGHAFEDTIQDTVIRYQRMNNKRALWVPGTDHAAIATQAKFEKEHYKKEKKSRHDYTREDFFQMIQEFALQNQKSILAQLHQLGLSMDWSRLAFTLDKDRELAVKTAFKEMFNAGLIYRGHRVVNWDPKGQTTVSDDEIEYEENKTKLYTFRYSKEFPIAISTTRPETKVGDTAVAVHPDDVRYQKYIGKEFNVEFCGVPLHIKIIADKEVDPNFGTGALGVTPAHSAVDYEIAQRHNLPLKPVINEFAKMTVGGELLEGKKTAEARLIVADWIRQQDLMEKEEDSTQNLSKAQRTGGVIEPLPKLQWFINVNKKFKAKGNKLTGIQQGEEITLKELMIRVVENKQIEIMPDRFEKIYYHWIENLRDWCISRQIIYGHQIPVWYKGEEIFCDVNRPKEEGWTQDTDTLDTWFSSGLWTFSTLGWPNETSDLKNFHPTSVMMPGYEILFFWVARMILMSGFLLGDIPFHKVYLHGMVRDKQGRKFSKSLNNGIDPLEMMAKYGTDALRFALVFGAAPGNDVMFDEQKIKGMKHFANKLWNIARYILSNTAMSNSQYPRLQSPEASADGGQAISKPEAKTEADKEILAKLEATIISVTNNLNTFNLHEAAQSIYQFTWREFADVYIEASKPQLADVELKTSTQEILNYSLIQILKLLHPFMPFVTEEIWEKLNQKDLLIVADWPKTNN